MKNLKDKKVLIGLVIILVIIIGVACFFIFRGKEKTEINTNKLDSEEIVKGQEEVTNLVKNYVDSINNIQDYAINNSKVEFSIKELRGIFNIDTSKFQNLKYHCDEDKTFIKYIDDYSEYIVVLDCKDFYLD